MKFTIRHFYVAEFSVEAATAEEALDKVSTDPHQFGLTDPIIAKGVNLSTFEYYDNIEPEALPE